MGRIGKQKRLLIEQANKRLLGENVLDVDKVLKDMKFKFGYGDLSSTWMEEFEEHMGADLINQLDTNEYTDLFADWMRSKAMGYDYEDLPYDDSDVYTLNEETNTIEDCKKQILNDIYEDNLYNLEDFCINYFKKPTNIDMGLIDRMLKWLKNKKGVDLTLCSLCDNKVNKSEEVRDMVKDIME